METTMKQHLWRYGMAVASVLVLLVLAIVLFAYSGVYGVGADDPHTKPIFALLQTLRYRSIHVRSESLVVPNLEDPKLILQGAGQYAAMCTGCHLRPGMKNSEIRPGLYPLPPNLSQQHVDPKDAFWTIKHGIKMSAMPAWGASHDDPTIWSMVAFLQKLPGMSTEEYLDTVRRAPPDTDMDMEGPDSDESKSHSHEHAHDSDGPMGQVAAPASGPVPK